MKDINKAQKQNHKIDNDKKEYLDLVKESVKNKEYFNDARSWYFFRYVNPICDRTLLTISTIISCIVLFFLVEIIYDAYPLKIEKPIYLKAKDQSIYYPKLIELKPKKNHENYDKNITDVDHAFAKYFISTYVKEREGYDFRDGDSGKITNKLDYIKNNSSIDEYNAFRGFLSKENAESPIHNFSKNIYKKVTIESVLFIKKRQEKISKRAFNYVFGELAKEVEVRFVVNEIATDKYGQQKTNSEKYLAKIKFDFSGVANSNNQTKIDFLVNKYSLFKVK